jgi:hypothetical protein
MNTEDHLQARVEALLAEREQLVKQIHELKSRIFNLTVVPLLPTVKDFEKVFSEESDT